MRRARGFTLIELLVAISIMALLAVLSWRGLDGMSRAREQARVRGDEVLALQAGLAQWGVDLDSITERPDGTGASQITPLDWDGRALRITRRSSGRAAEGLRVAAWSRRTLADGNSWWLRWESGPLVTVGQWTQAWAQAALWAQNPGDAERQREVPVARADAMQLFYYRNNAWTNPLSSADATTSTAASAAAAASAVATATALPDGVRLVLSLSPGQAFAGTITRDWVSSRVVPGT
ncbi:prepilin-type N-terminal cleavage/methylation domain-containing protein [Xylophilus rhododendri]|uniref:Prepilin-type N-terminal cleavage/methylation domain-containing protein n=1 Tax=Xylophilus rhododendri TaxID=2697032 RepID=A0A857J5C7_9BURK|nr:prepilin-type N-terminal cleavage/methylation domain-containing protein [Xylophilus rhododendri]QHI98299.1 prepilin-type N-terminal cleavage/methylation domain-containing protein [Xylophilus rhododendri]